MDFDKIILGYKNQIIPELEVLRNNETDLQKKTSLAEMVTALKKDLRSKEIQKRLMGQYINQEYIGYICFLSQLVEFEIKESILQYGEICCLLNKCSCISGNLKEKPLGRLIFDYGIFINDSILIQNLKEFNNLRIKAIHKLFVPDYTIEEVEEEIRKGLFFETVYEKIINPLLSYRLALTYKITTIRYGVQIPLSIKQFSEKIEKEISIQFKEIEKHIKV